jgi:hypothetical protein
MEYKHHLMNDKWIIEDVYRGKRDGFFIEAGATNGVNGSATVVLERDYNWDGICVEANNQQFEKISLYRKCKTDNRALYSESGKTLDFLLMRNRSGRSGLTDHLRKSALALAETPEADSVHVPKETVSLFDLLRHHQAPEIIEYFCLDVEGSEPQILGTFPFDCPYKILAFSIEGPHCNEIMLKNGYQPVKNPHTEKTFECYYLHKDINKYLP